MKKQKVKIEDETEKVELSPEEMERFIKVRNMIYDSMLPVEVRQKRAKEALENIAEILKKKKYSPLHLLRAVEDEIRRFKDDTQFIQSE